MTRRIDDTRNEDWTIRETVRNSLIKTRLHEDTNEIHDNTRRGKLQ